MDPSSSRQNDIELQTMMIPSSSSSSLIPYAVNNNNEISNANNNNNEISNANNNNNNATKSAWLNKGCRWTPEEHQLFLVAREVFFAPWLENKHWKSAVKFVLHKIGKTESQVTSHAQKFEKHIQDKKKGHVKPGRKSTVNDVETIDTNCFLKFYRKGFIDSTVMDKLKTLRPDLHAAVQPQSSSWTEVARPNNLTQPSSSDLVVQPDNSIKQFSSDRTKWPDYLMQHSYIYQVSSPNNSIQESPNYRVTQPDNFIQESFSYQESQPDSGQSQMVVQLDSPIQQPSGNAYFTPLIHPNDNPILLYSDYYDEDFGQMVQSNDPIQQSTYDDNLIKLAQQDNSNDSMLAQPSETPPIPPATASMAMAILLKGF